MTIRTENRKATFCTFGVEFTIDISRPPAGYPGDDLNWMTDPYWLEMAAVQQQVLPKSTADNPRSWMYHKRQNVTQSEIRSAGMVNVFNRLNGCD